MLGFLRRRIALKLTLTLVGFVGVSVLGAGFYLGHALERAAVESWSTGAAGASAVKRR
jgi:hypothetical protein